jgi:hypothetical protein
MWIAGVSYPTRKDLVVMVFCFFVSIRFWYIHVNKAALWILMHGVTTSSAGE